LKLEDLKSGSKVRGIVLEEPVTIVNAKWIGSNAIELTFKRQNGAVGSRLLYREDEPHLELLQPGTPWAFNADGYLYQLASEAHRIQLAYLFDPLLAVHTSLIEPLPHQITAVYEKMLPRQPLRYLLADDPGAGKTIMTGLLIKELRARGDLERCMVVCPGMLAEQWQDEMWEKFHLPFEILTNQKLEAARTGNWFLENNLVIARLDKLSRDEDVQAKLKQTDWDLIVVDEAHKMSAHVFGNEVKYTKRHQLGQLLAKISRHFLLLTATPHNGKEEDFQLFLSLLDEDRFAGRFREGVHTVDISDLMRRLSKEQLVKFDNTPLFPERRAYTVKYELSDLEAHLYGEVTNYVREEFNRADRIENGGRRNTVGFALTSIQRRLASSPEAIYRSLRRRRERLERRLAEERLSARGATARVEWRQELPSLSEEALIDLDEAPSTEYEELEDRIIDQATASRTIAELEAEIETLKRLERLAFRVRQSGTDKKWEELRDLLLDEPHMLDAHGHRRKLVIFSEHRDTVRYLVERIQTLLGRPEAVVTIHGGMRREERRAIQERFLQDKDVHVLVATDAAGEGINLQRAHLMVNYDLPWNPNRLEQRFGRIHRIGQTEVCHVWNLVADETREGDVFARLLEKIEAERKELGDTVFDVLGEVFRGSELRRLLIEAVRYGALPEVRNRLYKQVDTAFDRERLEELVEQRALTEDVLDTRKVYKIKEEMERAEAHRLQPYYIRSFFIEAFRHLGDTINEREHGRYEIAHVPGAVRERDRLIGTRNPVLQRYERVTFHKELISIPGKPLAEFVCPGHPLLDSVTDLILQRYRNLLKQGTILVDPEDKGNKIRVLFYLEHTIQDARLNKGGLQRTVSRRLQFSEINKTGAVRNAGYAPYLDYRSATEDEQKQIKPLIEEDWLRQEDLETRIVEFAVENLVPTHLKEVKQRREEMVNKTYAAVKDRLTKEITYWDHRAQELKVLEEAGRQPRMNWLKARERADELQRRLQKRLKELEEERHLSPLPPVVAGGALIVPQGLLDRLSGKAPKPASFSEDRREVESIAMQTVMEAERSLGYEPRDVSGEKLGWDIESRDPNTGDLRFIEVKGRVAGAPTVTITKNEILSAFNKPEAFILAIVKVDGDSTECRYLRRPFEKEPDFGVTSVNYSLPDLWAKGEMLG
jgi:superfamily II DNA or RNA helicase